MEGELAFRRVVTGTDVSGKAVFVDDSEMKGLTGKAIPGAELIYVWGDEKPPTVPNDGSLPKFAMHFPRQGGIRVALFSLPPVGYPVEWDPASPEALAEAEDKFPGLMQSFDPAHAGMHISQTVDIGFVLEGSVSLELDDGATKTFGAGDFIVQNGNRHMWSNTSGEPAWMVFVLIGADPA